jgi:hypothetical protein
MAELGYAPSAIDKFIAEGVVAEGVVAEAGPTLTR